MDAEDFVTPTPLAKEEFHGTDCNPRTAGLVDAVVLQSRRTDVRQGADSRASHGASALANAWARRALRRHRMVRKGRCSASRAAQHAGGDLLWRALLNGHPPRRWREGRDTS